MAIRRYVAVRRAIGLRDVLPVPDSRDIGMRTARPKDEQTERRPPKARSLPERPTPDADIGEDASHPKVVDLTVMHYTNYQPTPVFSSDGQPLMPCHPARARKLLAKGRAVPHHIGGILRQPPPSSTSNMCFVTFLVTHTPFSYSRRHRQPAIMTFSRTFVLGSLVSQSGHKTGHKTGFSSRLPWQATVLHVSPRPSSGPSRNRANMAMAMAATG